MSDGQDPTTGQEDLPNISGLPGITLGQTMWRGAARPDQWIPPQFLQTYGNYTSMFPSLGQQVGQALYGGVQGGAWQPPWMQTQLPARQNNQVDMSRYSPFQTGSRTMTNPYPLNGRVNMTTPNTGYVTKAGNPFIGQYQGLTGYAGNGPNQTGTQPQTNIFGQQPYGGVPTGNPGFPGTGGGTTGGVPTGGTGNTPTGYPTSAPALPQGGQQAYGGIPQGGASPFGTRYTPSMMNGTASQQTAPQQMGQMGQQMGGIPSALSSLSPQTLSQIMSFIGGTR